MKTKLPITLLVLLLVIFSKAYAQKTNKVTISGYVKEKGSGELLPGVVIFVKELSTGTETNTYGFYSVTIPKSDTVTLLFSSFGYTQQTIQVSLQENKELNIELVSEEKMLEQVEIVGVREEKVSETVQMSSVSVPVQQIKEIPTLLGEKDVMKVLQLMPGVQKGSEGNSGLYVRGGGPDQNLVILDDATLYNAYHLFGFFSIFNGDALKSVELTKGGFPAKYGGRLSSVIEMTMKEGNKEKLHGEGGIGIISSRLTLEGPIIKNKSSFLVSARRTYIDALIYPLMPKENRGGYNFHDLNAKINYDFGRKNKLYVSTYTGRDKMFFSSTYDNNTYKGGLYWKNTTATIRWNHLFNEKTFSNTSLIYSKYKFNIFEEDKYNGDLYKLNYSSNIRDYSIKFDIDYLPNPAHSFKSGLLSIYHLFTPSALVLRDSYSNENIKKATSIHSLENSIYIQDNWKPFPRFTLLGGIRVSNFITDEVSYISPEPRLSGAYKLKDDLSLKASYATMNQYIHLLSNTGIGLPTDLWVPSTKNIKPQASRQVAAGMAKDFSSKKLALTIEGYYKKSDNIIGYKEGATFLLIDDPSAASQINWEDNITSGQGWSYGAEFLLQKKSGKFSGWIGYTLSWTQLQFDSLNFGKKFYARYDRRHDISLVGIYHPSEKITLSATWVYGTGNAITLPISEYAAPTHQPNNPPRPNNPFYIDYVSNYGEKNSFRMAAYHRLDFGIQFHKKMKHHERTWEFSIYNVYSRQNPYFYFIGYEDNNYSSDSKRVLQQISLFPIIPSVSYNFKF
ncbi:MAG TPA: TonB-dependent receptor [Cytophagaceae bacterium]